MILQQRKKREIKKKRKGKKSFFFINKLILSVGKATINIDLFFLYTFNLIIIKQKIFF